MKVYKKYKDPNKELAAKVAQDFMAELEESLFSKLEEIKGKSNEIRNAMTTAMLTGKAKIEMIKESFENPEEKQKEIEKLLNEIAVCEGYLGRIDQLKES
jgi:adenylate kinase